MRRVHDDTEKRASGPRAPAPQRDQGERQTGGPAPIESMLESLQRSAGNAAVSRLVAGYGTTTTDSAEGERLPPSVKSAAERKLGSDMSGVRIHGDAAAAKYATELGAEAVTIGQDVYFRDGAPDATTSRGQKLYVHELTHAAQGQGQTEGDGPRTVSRAGSPPEREAATFSASGFAGVSGKPEQSVGSSVAHRQATTDEQELGEQAPGPATQAGAPKSKGAEPGTSTPAAANPLRDLFRVAVDQRIIAAQAALSGDKPDPYVAARELDGARNSVKALLGSFRETDPLMAAGLAALANGITSVIVAIEPLVGRGQDIPTILANTNSLLNAAASVGSEIK